MIEDGQVLGVDQVVNDPIELSMAMAKAGPDPEVALEATYGWYWAVDLLETNGARCTRWPSAWSRSTAQYQP